MAIRFETWIDLFFFVALLSTALALGGALAHALELPNKIGLSEHEYFIVQKAYRGWNRLAFLLLVELSSMSGVAVLSRQEARVLWPTVIAITCVLRAQVAFWIYTYPATPPLTTGPLLFPTGRRGAVSGNIRTQSERYFRSWP